MSQSINKKIIMQLAYNLYSTFSHGNKKVLILYKDYNFTNFISLSHWWILVSENLGENKEEGREEEKKRKDFNLYI